jgi:hypothetical protein
LSLVGRGDSPLPGFVGAPSPAAAVQLPDMRLKSYSYADYLAAKVSPSIARFITATSHPIPNFDIFAEPVDWDYFIPEGATAVVPLWSSGEDGYCRWVRHGREEYVCLSHESPEWWLIAYSEQGILAELYRQYFELWQWDDEGEDQKKCDAFSAYIGLAHQQEADRLLKCSYDDFKSWIKTLA